MSLVQRLAAGAAISALACAMSGAAYAQETTSSVHGTVTSGGTPLEGASITLVHLPSGTRQTTATGAGGVFDARGLRVGGPYTITATAKGLPAKSLSNVFLQVGQTEDVDIDIAGQGEVEALVVTAGGVKNTDQGPKTVLGRVQIQEVVSVNRDPRDLARRDILVAQDVNSSARVGVNSGGISIAGSNPRYNRIAVDGVSAQDNFGLNQGGLTTARGPVNLDAIEQFAVAAVPTDVENGDFVGGALNLVLRSGSNKFHGSVFDNYLNDGLVGTQTKGTKVKSNVHQKNYGGFLSGPIWKDRLFFAVSYEKYQSVDVTSFGVPGSGAPNIFLNNGTQATLDQVLNTYNNRYASKYNLGSIPLTTPSLDKKYSAKIDWNITDGQRASFTYRKAQSSNTLHPAIGATTLELSSQSYTRLDSDEAYTLELHSNWTDKLSTTFKATSRKYIDTQTPPSGQNYADVRVCTEATSSGSPTSCTTGFDQVNFGPDQFRHANALGEKELRFNFVAEYSAAPNLFKVGVQARRAQPADLFVPQSRGIYYFDSLADFAAGNASRLQYQNSVTGNPTDAGFRTTYWTYSLFAQDTLQVTDDIKVSAGVRVDTYDYPDKPILNPNFLQRYGFTNQKTIDGQTVVMPRVAVEWRATPDLKLNSGLGLFSGGAPDVLTGSPFYNTGYTTTSVDIQRTASGFVDANNTPGFTQAIGAAGLNNLVSDPTFGFQIPSLVRQLQQGTLTGTPQISPVGTVIALSPTFQLPAQWKFFASAQWDAWDGWRLSADFVAMKVQHDFTFYDARAQRLIINGQQQFLPDGRIRYDGLGAVPGKTSNNGLAVNSNNDIIEDSSSKGYSYTAAVSASKSWDWGGSLTVGYAHQKMRDLTAGLFFGTTAGSLYGSVPAGQDPNRDYLGRSVYEIGNRFKAEFDYAHKFFGDNETRFSLFGERQDGRSYGFTMSDAGSGRSQVFGVTRTAQALYVPDMSKPDALDPLKFGFVKFATQGDADRFKAYVTKFGVSPGLQGKYTKKNNPLSRIDMSLSQELPSLLPGHHFRVQADIRNVANLLNHKWGQVSEWNDGGGTSSLQLARAQCLDLATGNASTTTSATLSTNAKCDGYLYSQVPTTLTKQVNSALSLWYAQISLRYEF
jgi:outer membrane receptor for ferrienterochelin and colicin